MIWTCHKEASFMVLKARRTSFWFWVALVVTYSVFMFGPVAEWFLR